MLSKLFGTDNCVSGLVLRCALGVVLFPHGAQKLFGWFGGPGLQGTMDFFTTTLGLPGLLAVPVILVETLGALALFVGFAARPAAFGVLIIMIGAVFTVHLPNGFFMDWLNVKDGEGFEFHVLAGALALALVIRGAGCLSVDAVLSSRPKDGRN